MGYSMSLSLTKDAPIDEILTILKDTVFLKNNKSVHISNNNNEHGYSVAYDNGIYVSFRSLNQPESYFLHNFFKIVASVYGEKILNPNNNKQYPFYNYDKEFTLIIPHDEHISNKAYYKDFATYKDQIVDDDFIEDLHELLDEKANEARENGQDYEDDITIDIRYFSFDSVSFELPKNELPIFSVLHDLLTDESKQMKEILKYSKTLEAKLIEIKKT